MLVQIVGRFVGMLSRLATLIRISTHHRSPKIELKYWTRREPLFSKSTRGMIHKYLPFQCDVCPLHAIASINALQHRKKEVVW